MYRALTPNRKESLKTAQRGLAIPLRRRPGQWTTRQAWQPASSQWPRRVNINQHMTAPRGVPIRFKFTPPAVISIGFAETSETVPANPKFDGCRIVPSGRRESRGVVCE